VDGFFWGAGLSCKLQRGSKISAHAVKDILQLLYMRMGVKASACKDETAM